MRPFPLGQDPRDSPKPCPRSLLSKFSITTDGTKGLVIQSAVIEAPDQVEVKACRKDPHLSVVRPPTSVEDLDDAYAASRGRLYLRFKRQTSSSN